VPFALCTPGIDSFLANEIQVIFQIRVKSLQRIKQFTGSVLPAFPTAEQLTCQDTIPHRTTGLSSASPAWCLAFQASDRLKDPQEALIIAKGSIPSCLERCILLKVKLCQLALQFSDKSE
jgi:hypothetical protein